MIGDSCLNGKRAYDYGRAYSEKKLQITKEVRLPLSYGRDIFNKNILLFVMIV